MRIAIDAMGGDYAPVETIAGALKWVEEEKDNIILVGQEEIIKNELSKYSYDYNLISIVNASQVISMDESPALALKKKKDSSIVVASKLVRENQADAVLSCGSTGAQMAAALFILGRMKGIERPPIVAQIPNQTGGVTLMIDVGANVDCKPAQLLQFAVVGRAYAQSVLNIKDPRVGLLSNGEEEGKGNSVVVDTYEMMKNQSVFNFIGNIEGRDIFSGKSDIVVCDGFTGNIILKSLEGLAQYMARIIAAETGYIPKAFSSLDYTQVGGAPLLGVKGISIVCHGSSKRETVYNGIKIARDCFANNIVNMQEEQLKSII